MVNGIINARNIKNKTIFSLIVIVVWFSTKQTAHFMSLVVSSFIFLFIHLRKLFVLFNLVHGILEALTETNYSPNDFLKFVDSESGGLVDPCRNIFLDPHLGFQVKLSGF